MSNLFFEKIQLEIVSSAIDDVHGLYEIIWALNSSHPHVPQIEKINQSKLAIIPLIDNDIIDIYQCYRNENPAERLVKNDALAIVLENKNWDVTQSIDNQYYGFYSSGQKCLDEEKRLVTAQTSL
ncbi:MAG: hypothetical protein ACRYFR_11250 [Janthinobacterium lividum]